MFRSCTAAAPHSSGSCFYNALHHSGKFFRGYIVDGLPVSLSGQSCIWLYNNRKRRVLQKLFQNRNHLFRTHAAVYSEGIHPQSFQKRDNRRHIRSCKQFPSFIKNCRSKHRERGILFSGKYSGFQFISITHGFNMNQVSSRFFSQNHYLPECLICCFKFQVSHWFEQFSRRTYIQSRQDSIRPPALLRRSFYMSHGRIDDFLQRTGIIMKFESICAKCISQDNVTARFHITPVYTADFIRMSDIPELGKLSRLQPLFLKKCSHSAVKKKQFFSKSISYHNLFLIYPFCCTAV